MARDNRRGLPDLDLPKAKLNKESLRESAALLAYLRPYRWQLVAACVGLIISSGLTLCFPFLAGAMMDVATSGTLTKGPAWLPHHISSVALLMLSVITLQAINAYVYSVSLTRI